MATRPLTPFFGWNYLDLSETASYGAAAFLGSLIIEEAFSVHSDPDFILKGYVLSIAFNALGALASSWNESKNALTPSIATKIARGAVIVSLASLAAYFAVEVEEKEDLFILPFFAPTIVAIAGLWDLSFSRKSYPI